MRKLICFLVVFMLIGCDSAEQMKDENKKANRLNFPKGSKPHYPSQTNGNAKIKINSNTAIPKLKKLSKLYTGVNNPQGFLTDLRIALGIPDSPKASKYGEYRVPSDSDY